MTEKQIRHILKEVKGLITEADLRRAGILAGALLASAAAGALSIIWTTRNER